MIHTLTKSKSPHSSSSRHKLCVCQSSPPAKTILLNSCLFHIWEFHQILFDFALFNDALWPAAEVAPGAESRNITSMMNIEKMQQGFNKRLHTLYGDDKFPRLGTLQIQHTKQKRLKLCHTQWGERWGDINRGIINLRLERWVRPQ